LSKLDLELVHLQGCSAVFKHIDFSILTSLRVVHCMGALRFLQTLVMQYSQGPCNLTELAIVVDLCHGGLGRKSHQALEDLLDLVSPLQQLQLDTGSDKLVSTACLLRHGTKLQSLCLSAASTTAQVYLSLLDLNTLLRGCPYLQQLAITLCPVDLGFIDDLGVDSTLGGNTGASKYPELEVMLIRVSHYHLSTGLISILTYTQDIIASVPTLHTLRILSLPVIESHQPALAAIEMQMDKKQATMQRYANQIMAYLVKRGSKVKLLAVKPLRRVGRRKLKDGNVHCWLGYFYVRSWGVDDKGAQHVVARPLGRPDLDMPESTIVSIEV
jgi:hypothetical protein